MVMEDGGDKLLWHQPGNFTSEASVEFILMDPVDIPDDISANVEGAIGDEGFVDDGGSVVVSKTP